MKVRRRSASKADRGKTSENDLTKMVAISRLARSTMLSKILVRSGLSRLLWIKDAGSYSLTRLCPRTCVGCLLRQAFAFALSRSNFPRVSRFALLVNPLARILLHSFVDPLGRRSPSGTMQ